MPPEKIDLLADDVKPLVLELLRQISELTVRVNELLAQNKALLARIAELEAKHGKPPKTPDNSSLPPSRGQKGNVAEPTRVKKARKGHPGAARALEENPDATRDNYAERCACGAALEEAGQELARAWDHEVIASDETSARVKGKTYWQWTFGCATAVYHVIAPTRGKCVPTHFLAGVRPKVWLSDRLPAQCTHAEAHQFCLAHLIRDAQYAIDHGDTIFAPQFKAFLKDACAVGHRRPDLADSTIATHRRRPNRSIKRGFAPPTHFAAWLSLTAKIIWTGS